MGMQVALWAWTLLALVAMATAAKGRARNSGCSAWTYEKCNTTGGCGPGKKTGTRTGATCAIKERKFRCVVPCVDGPQDLAGRTHGRDGRRKNKPVPCRYERVPWGDCSDATTGVRTRTLTLKKGDETCQQTKVETKKCKAASAGTACKYQRGPWGDCDTTTNMKTRTLTLKRGDATNCEATKPETKICKGSKVGGKSTKCRYQRGEWSACDPKSNERTRTNTLKRANDQCKATELEKKPCKKACRYVKGEWGTCNEAGMQQRLDTLKAGSPPEASCESTRTIDRRCRNKDSKPRCKYNFGTWSECTEGKRTRTKSLISGDQVCDKTRLVIKPCKVKSAGRCEFGPWGGFGDCINGVRTKSRTVTRGGEECQRRAVRTKPCRT